ncbi:MAG: fluoroquinolone resistance protein [Celeribacter sp.]|jgi:fluoroquinolone resistance protein
MTLEEASARRQVTAATFRNDGLDGFSIFETEFVDCVFVNCVFDGEKIGMSGFHNCRFTDCSFRDTRMLSCQFNTTDLDQKCVWSRCNLSDATLVECDLSRNQMVACKGFLLRLESCNLTEAQMDIDVHRHVNARLNMGGLSCHKSNFYEARMVNQDLQGSTFELCDLRGANLSGSNMSTVNFLGSNLNGIVLKKTALTGVNLAHADIDELDLSPALTTDNMTISPDQRDILLRYFGVTVIS